MSDPLKPSRGAAPPYPFALRAQGGPGAPAERRSSAMHAVPDGMPPVRRETPGKGLAPRGAIGGAEPLGGGESLEPGGDPRVAPRSPFILNGIESRRTRFPRPAPSEDQARAPKDDPAVRGGVPSRAPEDRTFTWKGFASRRTRPAEPLGAPASTGASRDAQSGFSDSPQVSSFTWRGYASRRTRRTDTPAQGPAVGEAASAGNGAPPAAVPAATAAGKGSAQPAGAQVPGGWRNGTPTTLAQAGADSRASAGPGPRTVSPPVRDHSLQAYMTARAVDDRRLDEAETASLLQARASLDATRRALFRGRGNVSTDIEASQGDSTVRTAAGRWVGRSYLSKKYSVKVAIAKFWPFKKTVKPEQGLTAAAGAIAAGAGNCGEHAFVGALVHAPRLEAGQKLHVVGHAEVDHMWTEIRNPGDAPRDIVIDAWGEGPVVFVEDAEFAADREKVRTSRVFDHDQGVQAGDTVTGWLENDGAGIGAFLAKAEEKIGPNYRYPRDKVFLPTQVISAAFDKRARERLEAPVDEKVFAGLAHEPDFVALARRRRLLNEVVAAGAARATGSSVAQGSKDALDIVKEAHHLRGK
ncbi:Transglutaminase superfamily protein [Paracidovorax anthurii]|uniref:Uncharacterized protein n=1 Tax=Paracidovorax anthurii TaxID=78229 RepID=A0A328ZFV7_9BURK|nr:hypothetical protein AX018_101071 [Paracidovorax anthurii]